MGRVRTAVMAIVGMVVAIALAYFRILMTVSLLAGIALGAGALVGYPPDVVTFAVLGGPGIAYYVFKVAQGVRDGRRNVAEPVTE